MTLLQTTLNLDINQAAVDAELAGSSSTFGELVGSILSAVMIIAGLLLLLYLVWGAIEWITAGGDNGKIQSARNRITQSIIGIIVLASTVALFNLVQSFLGVEILNFTNSNTSPTGFTKTTNKTSTLPPVSDSPNLTSPGRVAQ